MAIGRFHAHVAGAADAEGKPNAVLRAFALHLQEHLLAPSGRGCERAGTWVASVRAGCFTYEPPRGVVWEVQSLGISGRWPAAAVERLASFLSVWLALVLLATGCAGPRPLKGGKAVTTHKPAGVVEQTVVQGENAS